MKGTEVKDDGKSARTSHKDPELQKLIWPCDVLQNEFTATEEVRGKMESMDPLDNRSMSEMLQDSKRKGDISFQAPQSESQELKDDSDEDNIQRKTQVYGDIAHLVPASPLHASLYYNVAKWVFGLGKDTSEEVVQKTIHGSKTKGQNDRFRGVGLKHFASNKLRLSSQARFFDTDANVLIIPIFENFQEVREWNGSAYNAVFMIAADNKKGQSIKAVADGVRFTEKGESATKDDIEFARISLALTIKALHASLCETEPCCLAPSHKKLLKEYRDNFANLDGEKLLQLPKERNLNEHRPVRKIKFVENGQINGHPAPDPMLLLVKAAINWSKFHNQQLLAGGHLAWRGKGLC